MSLEFNDSMENRNVKNKASLKVRLICYISIGLLAYHCS